MDELKKKKIGIPNSYVSSTMLLRAEITIVSLVRIDISFWRRVLVWNFDTDHLFPFQVSEYHEYYI